MRVAVVGAGVAGLACAAELVAAGHDVVVLDGGRAAGGRMATRRIAGATLDHGAQFLTTRSPAFAAVVDGWEAAGAATTWCHGFVPGAPDGHRRVVGTGGMGRLARTALADPLGERVRCDALVQRLVPRAGGWTLELADGTVVDAGAVVLTPPAPQAAALLEGAGVAVPDELRDPFEPTLAALVALDGPSGLEAPGGRQDPDGPVTFVADNALKGISAVPSLTLHAGAEVSRALWGEPDEAIATRLLVLAGPVLGRAGVVAAEVVRWRLARPARPLDEPCLVLERRVPAPLVVAGDLFARAKVEGAWTSGRAAAAALSA